MQVKCYFTYTLDNSLFWNLIREQEKVQELNKTYVDRKFSAIEETFSF